MHDLWIMKSEFNEVYTIITNGAYARLLRMHELKLKAIEACEKQLYKNVSIKVTIGPDYKRKTSMDSSIK